MTKKFVFQFGHVNDRTGEKTVKNYYFDFINATDEEIQAKYDESMECLSYEDFLYSIEEFGIHDDFSAGGDVLHGFKSWEVDPARYNTVIKHWRKYFTDQVGLEIGPTYITEGYRYEDEEGITV